MCFKPLLILVDHINNILVGNIVFASLMCAVSLVLIVMSARDLASGGGDSETKTFHLASVIAVAIAFCVKLSLFLYCFAIRNLYSDVRQFLHFLKRYLD